MGGEESSTFSRDELVCDDHTSDPSRALSFSGFSPSLATCLSVLPREAERDKDQENAQRWLGGPRVTEMSRDKPAKGISRVGMSIPTRHTRAAVLYTEA